MRGHSGSTLRRVMIPSGARGAPLCKEEAACQLLALTHVTDTCTHKCSQTVMPSLLAPHVTSRKRMLSSPVLTAHLECTASLPGEQKVDVQTPCTEHPAAHYGSPCRQLPHPTHWRTLPINWRSSKCLPASWSCPWWGAHAPLADPTRPALGALSPSCLSGFFLGLGS